MTSYNCDKEDTIPRTARHPRKMEMKTQTWFQSGFQKSVSILNKRNSYQKGKAEKGKRLHRYG
jgi:hypothetical protein